MGIYDCDFTESLLYTDNRLIQKTDTFSKPWGSKAKAGDAQIAP